MDIAVDFDGTCVAHEYPNVGKDIGAIPVLKRLVSAGHKLILYTMRSGIELHFAQLWFMQNEITLYGVQYNPDQVKWSASNKCYAQLYIDDAALGAPLLQQYKTKELDYYGTDPINFTKRGTKFYFKDQEIELIGRPYINWKTVERILEQKNLI